jgi:tRNA A-37 threonylcarbamoyl transferase component Bud32
MDEIIAQNQPASSGQNKPAAYLTTSARVSSSIVCLIGILETIGWAFSIELLKHPIESEPATPSGAAFCFALSSLAFFFITVGKPQRWRLFVGALLALIVGIAGGACFLEHTCQLDWTLSYPLIESGNGAPFTFPGPMLPDVGLFFLLLGTGLTFLAVQTKRLYCVPQFLALAVFIPNLMILSSYMLGMGHLCAYFGCVKFSPITALTFAIASYTLFVARPDAGMAAYFTKENVSGMVLRRTFVGAILFMLLLLPRQWLINLGEAHQLFDAPTVNIGTATACFVTIGAFIWWCLRKLDTAETEKHEAMEVISSMTSKIADQTRQLKLVCLECGKQFPIEQNLTECPDDYSMLYKVADNLRPGAVFNEKYEIVRPLGSGGMSTVYLAKHLLMNKTVAIKVLQTHVASDTKVIQRFHREAQAVSQLSHENIVGVYDFGVSQDGQAFMVMEFLKGMSLCEIAQQAGTLPWHDLAPICLQLLDGLAHAHAKGIVHRDLKPGNIMLIMSDDETSYLVKIVDFGFARTLGLEEQRITQSGDVFGSPSYMSPEQCRGVPADHRSDIYALGCIMFEILTGSPPFGGESIPDTLLLHLQAPSPLIPAQFGVPSWLYEVIDRCLQKRPEDRFQSATEVAEAINQGLHATV